MSESTDFRLGQIDGRLAGIQDSIEHLRSRMGSHDAGHRAWEETLHEEVRSRGELEVLFGEHARAGHAPRANGSGGGLGDLLAAFKTLRGVALALGLLAAGGGATAGGGVLFRACGQTVHVGPHPETGPPAPSVPAARRGGP